MDIYQHSKLYNAYYYTRASSGYGCGHDWERSEENIAFFRSIADRIAFEIHPDTVLDAGCAMGLLVKFLRQRDVKAFGIDISEYAIRNIHPEAKPYCWIGSVSQPLPQNFDLIVCIEILEHLPHFEAENAIENFCRHSDDILFSSTPFDYKEGTHFNVQPPEYWAEAFVRHGFLHDLDFDASFITPWAVRFRRQSEPIERLVRKYERKFFLLWKENVDLRDVTLRMRQELASKEETIHNLTTQLSKREPNPTSYPLAEPVQPESSIHRTECTSQSLSSTIKLWLRKLGSRGWSAFRKRR